MKSLSVKDNQGHTQPIPIVVGFDWMSAPIGTVSFTDVSHLVPPSGDPKLFTHMILSPAWTTDDTGNPKVIGYGLVPMPKEMEHSKK